MRDLSKAGMRIGIALSLMAASVCGCARAQENGAPRIAAQGAGVRMVRLSAVRGKVELDRGTGRGFEAGFTNLPILQGSQLRTVGLGWAEVEFEDGGSARITPETQIKFDTLARGVDGQLRNTLTLTRGTLYVSRMKGDKSDLLVMVSGKKVVLPPSSHVRLDVYPSGSELVVVRGSVRVEDEIGTATLVDRNHALRFGGAEGTKLVQAKAEAPGLYDRWDAQSAAYHQALVSGGGYGNSSGNLSGLRDMQYYGGFSNLDGCGRVWQPYLTGAGFDPAASGVWAFYPGSGYTFVSPYAWGWTTFNSGFWVSCGSRGWGWRPGAWIGLKNHPIVEPIRGPGHHPRPVEEPAAGRATVVNAGDHEMLRSKASLDGTPQFTKDSAGLGIPRGSIDNLREISRAVVAGRAAPEPEYTGDVVAADPVALTVLARASVAPVWAGQIAGTVRGMELTALNSRPVAPVNIASGRGGYSGGGFAAGSFGGRSSSASFSPAAGGGASSGRSGSTSSGTVGSSSIGASGGSSSGGGHH